MRILEGPDCRSERLGGCRKSVVAAGRWGGLVVPLPFNLRVKSKSTYDVQGRVEYVDVMRGQRRTRSIRRDLRKEDFRFSKTAVESI